jgi:hypothetical protein
MWRVGPAVTSRVESRYSDHLGPRLRRAGATRAVYIAGEVSTAGFIARRARSPPPCEAALIVRYKFRISLIHGAENMNVRGEAAGESASHFAEKRAESGAGQVGCTTGCAARAACELMGPPRACGARRCAGACAARSTHPHYTRSRPPCATACLRGWSRATTRWRGGRRGSACEAASPPTRCGTPSSTWAPRLATR